MKVKYLAAIGLVSMGLLAGCSTTSKEDAHSASSNSVKVEMDSGSKEEHKGEDHLDYSAQKDWTFEAGDSQSPIDIVTDSAEKMKDSGALELNYQEQVVDEVDNGHSIQVDDTGEAVINGRNYELTQFHFHAESEHTLNGEHFPIEVHFVNKAQDGRLAVVGVFFKEGKENAGFETVLKNIKKGEKTSVEEAIKVTDMIPTDKTYYHYLGSLTTPPLSENVEWYVMETPIEVSKEQIEAFNKYYDGNNREVQPLNDRVVLKHTEG